MNFNKINIVLAREFSIRVKKKSFIVTTILTPLLFAGLMIIPSVVMMNDGGEEQQKILVVDNSNLVAPTLESDEDINYVISEDKDIETLKSNYKDLGVDVILNITALDSANNVSMTAYSQKQINMDLSRTLSSAASSAIEDYKLKTYDIDNLEEILHDVRTRIKLDSYTLGEDGSEKKSVVEISMALSYILTFLIYMFVLMFGNMVMRSVIDEKSSRIVEVVVSSVKPFDLMIGKILGVASVAVLQFLIWIVFTTVLVFGFQYAVGTEMMMQEVNGVTEQVQVIGGSAELGNIMSAISEIDFVYILGNFFIYFVLGYLLYAAMFAAVGSAVENEADTQQLSVPVTMPLIAGLFIMLHTFQHPDSALSVWASIIPFTSPMVMLARIPFEGGVPLWQLLLSIGLLLLTFIGIVYLSGKIYRVGILMYGKKAGFKDLWKWLKY